MSGEGRPWIAFDYGGTLAPVSPPVTAAALAGTLRRHALQPLPARLDSLLEAALAEARADARRTAIEHPLAGTLSTVLAKLEATVPVPLGQIVSEAFASIGDASPYPGVIDVVTEVCAAGYFCVLAANSLRTQDVRRATLRAAGLEGLFSDVVISSELGFRKPHPRFYGEMLRRIGATADRVTFVGDTYEKDVSGPIAAGMRAIWINAHPAPRDRRTAERDRVLEVRSLDEAREALLKPGISR